LLCKYFKVSRQAYYERLKHNLKQQSEDERLLDFVRGIRYHHPKMGTKKLFFSKRQEIKEIAPDMGRDKFFAFLGKHKLLVYRRRKYAVTTQSFGRFREYKDHYNGKKWNAPHQAWVSDITYVRIKEGFHYLSLITDAYSRKIIGYKLAPTLETKWCVQALEMAIKQCPKTKGIVHHSDRGFQYCSHLYTNRLKKSKIDISMGEVGNCYDNAMAERVNGILKQEYMLDETFKDTRTAHQAVEQAVKLYNKQRPHWALNLKIPDKVHNAA
jgi:putative transposase